MGRIVSTTMPKKGDPCPWCRQHTEHMKKFPHTMTTHKNCLYKHEYPRDSEAGPPIRLITGVHKPDGAVLPNDIQFYLNIHHKTPIMDDAEDYSVDYDIDTLFLAKVYPEKVPQVLALPSREPTHAELMSMTGEQFMRYKEQQARQAIQPKKSSLKSAHHLGREDSLMSELGAVEDSKAQARRDLDAQEKDLQDRLESFERDTQSRREKFSREQKRISKSQKKDKATIGSAVKKFVTAANMTTDAIKECMTEEEYNLFHIALLDPGRTFALKRTSTRQSTRESSANSEADITKSRVRFN